MERLLRTRLLTALVLVVVFAAGVALGFAVDRTLGAEPVEEMAARPDSASSSRDRQPMYEQVGPTEEQKILIDSIVAQSREDMKQLHAEFRAAYNPRYQALVKETRDAIKAVLTPEQAKAYDSLLTEYDQRRARRSSRDNRE
ncbi:MAG: hypothetical protein PVJ02_09900 [Gemmatimonadota bacterium]|jgi:Spy/CpxP family protein refolding chaperone